MNSMNASQPSILNKGEQDGHHVRASREPAHDELNTYYFEQVVEDYSQDRLAKGEPSPSFAKGDRNLVCRWQRETLVLQKK